MTKPIFSISLLILLMLFVIALPATAQTERPKDTALATLCDAPKTPAEARLCAWINDLLDELEACDKVKATGTAATGAGETAIKSGKTAALSDAEVIDKQGKLIAFLTQSILDTAGMSKKEKRGFWASVGQKLKELADKVTDPNTILAVSILIDQAARK